MFSFFGNKKKKLEQKYARLLEESQRLSLTDRKRSDLKFSEAEQVLKQLEQLEQQEVS